MKKIIQIIFVFIFLLIISFINTTISNKITGNAVLEASKEYSGIGIFLIVSLGIIGIIFVLTHHQKQYIDH